jgi:hypothetical protein
MVESGSSTSPAAGIDMSLSRRRLFAVGAGSLGLAAVLAACGSDEPPAPGGGGVAPDITDLPEAEVNDVVYLRTLTSLEHSIVEVYAALAAIDGLGEEATALLSRFSDDHVAAAGTLAELTADAGGEPYECANAWMMDRTLQPILDHIVGVPSVDTGVTTSIEDPWEIPPTDDPDRDALLTINALETVAAATAQQYVERIADPALRAEVIGGGAAASRRAAVSALRSNPAPEGYVSPVLTSGEPAQPDEEGFTPLFAIDARYGQLAPVALMVGDVDQDGVRFTMNVETPAENAYIYDGMTCPT